MIGTILSLITAIFFAFHIYGAGGWLPSFGNPFFVVSSLTLLIAGFLGSFLSWQSIVRTQQKVMAAAQEFFFKDNLLRLAMGYLFALVLFSLYMTLAVPIAGAVATATMIYIWFVTFGIGFDVLRWYVRRCYSYSNVEFLVQKVNHELERAVTSKDETKAFQLIEMAIETCASAMRKGQIGFATSSLSLVQQLVETYVKQAARIEVMQLEKSGPTFLDKVNFICIFVSERLEWVFEIALKEDMQPLCDNLISQYGKLGVFFARHYPQAATLPISFLMKCAKLAQEKGESEVVTRAALTLSETCKAFLAVTKERNESIRELSIGTLNSLEKLVKMIFKKSKEINPILLMQPFAEIGEFIGSDQMKSFPDRDIILNEIRRILMEFQSLQIVKQNMETIAPAVAEDTTATFKEDHPYTLS